MLDGEPMPVIRAEDVEMRVSAARLERRKKCIVPFVNVVELGAVVMKQMVGVSTTNNAC